MYLLVKHRFLSFVTTGTFGNVYDLYWTWFTSAQLLHAIKKTLFIQTSKNFQRVSTTFLTFSAVTEQQSGKHQSQTIFFLNEKDEKDGTDYSKHGSFSKNDALVLDNTSQITQTLSKK